LSDPKELVSVYQGANLTEAHFVMNLLVDEGIEASVTEENEALSGLAMSSASVWVRHEDETRARRVVDEYDAEQVRRADRPDWTCPKCGVTVVGAFDECDACGADRPGSEEAE